MKQLRGFQKRQGAELPDGVKDNPMFRSAMEKYGGMDENALINSLLTQIETARQNGTYNPGQMQATVQMLVPYLNPAQTEKLQNVMRIIDESNE